jgi:hypothetical protein
MWPTGPDAEIELLWWPPKEYFRRIHISSRHHRPPSSPPGSPALQPRCLHCSCRYLSTIVEAGGAVMIRRYGSVLARPALCVGPEHCPGDTKVPRQGRRGGGCGGGTVALPRDR